MVGVRLACAAPLKTYSFEETTDTDTQQSRANTSIPPKPATGSDPVRKGGLAQAAPQILASRRQSASLATRPGYTSVRTFCLPRQPDSRLRARASCAGNHLSALDWHACARCGSDRRPRGRLVSIRTARNYAFWAWRRRNVGTSRSSTAGTSRLTSRTFC
jgi:hypothetical protein